MDHGNPKTGEMEIVGLFATKDQFEAAVQALLNAGFERTDLSVLASHESLDAAGAPGKPFSDVLTALAVDLKYEAPLVASGAVWLAGGPLAVSIATVIGAAVSGVAIKEVLDEVTSTPHTEDFARSIAAGSIILWVRVGDESRAEQAESLLMRSGGDNVHRHENED